jgi:TolA-binding protein
MATKKGRSSKDKSVDLPELEDDKLYLSADEMHLLEVGDLEAKLRRANKRIKEQQGQMLQLQIELLQEKLKVNSHSQLEHVRNDKELLSQHKSKIDAIREKYGVGPNDVWGHDPISGEIVIDRKE